MNSTFDLANNIVSMVVGLFILIGVFIGFVAWFIRLESEVKYLKQRISEYEVEKATHKKDTEAALEAIWKKLETVQEGMNKLLAAISKMEGKMESYIGRQ